MLVIQKEIEVNYQVTTYECGTSNTTILSFTNANNIVKGLVVWSEHHDTVRYNIQLKILKIV